MPENLGNLAGAPIGGTLRNVKGLDGRRKIRASAPYAGNSLSGEYGNVTSGHRALVRTIPAAAGRQIRFKPPIERK
jgi:hypothetical protein